MTLENLPSSFRDPSGYVFIHEGTLYRRVNQSYAEEYDRLMNSGLYSKLTDSGLLVEHVEIDAITFSSVAGSGAYKYVKPTRLPYISYPYEWCFSQLKEAALTTLQIQMTALQYDMSLKDASAYNIQFIGSRPVFIDTLSFAQYSDGTPWIAYKQFCQHFLGPLALMSKRDARLRNLLLSYIDGIPLDLVSRLLPRSSLLNFGIASHIHLHAASQRKHSNDASKSSNKAVESKLSRKMFTTLIESLSHSIGKLKYEYDDTEWGHYYDDTNYSERGMNEKEKAVNDILEKYIPKNNVVHDFGANTGRFSRLAAVNGRYVVAHDIDDVAVDRHYKAVRKHKIDNVLPLVLDLSNPSPSIGWDLRERDSIIDRTSGCVAMALALIHHLAISNNLPLDNIAQFFSRISEYLVIEFVPKEDSQVKRLLATREDIFPNYTSAGFEDAFRKYFNLIDIRPIGETCRSIYTFSRK